MRKVNELSTEPKNAKRIPKMARKEARKNMLPVTRRTAGPVRLNSPMAAAAAADVQGAVVEKGIEVMGQMVDKQLQIIDEAQEKAENFLKKEVRSHQQDYSIDYGFLLCFCSVSLTS